MNIDIQQLNKEQERLEKRRIWERQYYKDNKEKLLEKSRKWKIDNSEILLSKNKIYRSNNPEKVKIWKHASYLIHKEQILTKQKKDKIENPEKFQVRNKKYYQSHKKERNEYLAFKMQDPEFKLIKNLRSRINTAIRKKETQKITNTVKLLGASIPEVRKYLENQFTEGMSWGNHGIYGWHIDHIKPINAFDIKNPKEQKTAFHYSNLQPLWSFNNLSKGAKIL